MFVGSLILGWCVLYVDREGDREEVMMQKSLIKTPATIGTAAVARFSRKNLTYSTRLLNRGATTVPNHCIVGMSFVIIYQICPLYTDVERPRECSSFKSAPPVPIFSRRRVSFVREMYGRALQVRSLTRVTTSASVNRTTVTGGVPS